VWLLRAVVTTRLKASAETTANRESIETLIREMMRTIKPNLSGARIREYRTCHGAITDFQGELGRALVADAGPLSQTETWAGRRSSTAGSTADVLWRGRGTESRLAGSASRCAVCASGLRQGPRKTRGSAGLVAGPYQRRLGVTRGPGAANAGDRNARRLLRA
jgi:hypothetical protein